MEVAREVSLCKLEPFKRIGQGMGKCESLIQGVSCFFWPSVAAVPECLCTAAVLRQPVAPSVRLCSGLTAVARERRGARVFLDKSATLRPAGSQPPGLWKPRCRTAICGTTSLISVVLLLSRLRIMAA